MKSFTEYEQRKHRLLQAYDMVLAGDLLPIEETGATQVRERRSDLESGRFLVAVCGRIKAGKSTLLNALLFGDWVVPTDDLPLTAKNTLIEYGETPSLEVTFFNSDEWTALTRQLREDNPAVAAEFFAEVEQAREHGVRETEFIRRDALVRQSNDIAELGKFVTPVAKGGIYTPFVKQVRLAHPHPWLKSVTIADTPGVDDPYKFREDQTKQFVTRAGAVLYVTYAGQAMAQQDFDFLDEYLVHVAPQRRLIAVNKADTLRQGSGDVAAYLRSLMDSPEPAIRNVFGRPDSVCMVSALGSLIGEALRHKRPLSEDNEYYRGQLERSGYLEAGRDGIDALRSLVEERLVSQDGGNVILDHTRFLDALFERKLRLSQRDLTLLEQRLHDLGQTGAELEAQIDDIQRQLASMGKTLDKGRLKIGKQRDRAMLVLERAFDKAWLTISANVQEELDRDPHIDGMGNRASWSFNKHFEIQREILEAALKACVGAVEDALKDFGEDLRGAWVNWQSAAYLDDVLSYSLYDTLHSLRGMLADVGSASRLEQVRADSTVFYQRWFNTAGGRRAASTAIVQSLRDQLGPAMRTEYEHAKKQLETEIKHQLENVAAQLKEVQTTRLADIEKLTQGKADRVRERATVDAEIATLQTGLARLKALQACIRDELGS